MKTSVLRPQLFAGKRVLITGGGTGLGLGMAKQLGLLGASVFLCSRRVPVVEKAADLLRKEFAIDAYAYAMNVREPESIDATIDKIWNEHGGIDSLINNAAGNFVSPTESLSVNGFNAIADTVFKGTFFVTQKVGKRWIADNKTGSIVSILVPWVWTGSPYVVTSAMSKGGIDVMTKSLAIEWGPKNIRLNAVSPGIIPTETASANLRPHGSGLDQFTHRNPTRRLGNQQELADLVAFLLCDENSWINGQTIAIDGGDWLANGAYYTEYAEWTNEQWDEFKAKALARNAENKKQH